jgi:hypothetical protein
VAVLPPRRDGAGQVGPAPEPGAGVDLRAGVGQRGGAGAAGAALHRRHQIVRRKPGEWEDWYRNAEPENPRSAALPGEWEPSATSFSACYSYGASAWTGWRRRRRPTWPIRWAGNTSNRRCWTWQECYADSTPGAPLIFVLSPGVDPTANLAQLAATKVGRRQVALGGARARAGAGGDQAHQRGVRRGQLGVPRELPPDADVAPRAAEDHRALRGRDAARGLQALALLQPDAALPAGHLTARAEDDHGTAQGSPSQPRLACTKPASRRSPSTSASVRRSTASCSSR